MRLGIATTTIAALFTQSTAALVLDVNDAASIKTVSSTIAHELMKYYTGNITNTPTTLGILPQPYYWWEAGALWGTMLQYHHDTGDSSYNEVVHQALQSQFGPNFDYIVPAQRFDLGNDDQAFWGMSIMSAAEQDFIPPTIGSYSWGELTERLWNVIASRWDTSTCNGGFRWQIYPENRGYDYKNSVTQGSFFQLSARLARYTGNSTYIDWALKSYDWSVAVGLINSDYRVFDGAGIEQNCTIPDNVTWTYNLALYLYGSAVMYNITDGADLWTQRTQGFLDAAAAFFSPFDNSTNIMYENACETVNTCNTDEFSFKAYLARFMWGTIQMAPFTKDTITKYLRASAESAAQACSGGARGVTCGTHWYFSAFDAVVGVGQQMSALEVIQGLLVEDASPPFTMGRGAEQVLHGEQGFVAAEVSMTAAGDAPASAPQVTVTVTMC